MRRRNISIKKIVIITFMIGMLVSISSIGYLVFHNWLSSAEQTTETFAGEMHESIYNQIYSFLLVPEQINKSNHRILEDGILSLSNIEHRDQFFSSILNSCNEEIYSFSYGTERGEYYGARRNEAGAIEIMRNNDSTGGDSWYYSVNEDFTADKLVAQRGKFDPRTRAWYKTAAAAKGPTFSPIYKHFVMDDLTISFSYPVYNKAGDLQGVLGAHLLLTDIGEYLRNTISKYDGYAIILEKGTNDLVANSMGIDNFSVQQDGTLKRFKINEIQNADISGAYEQYSVSFDSDFLFSGNDHKLYINVREIRMEGLEWVVVSAIPNELLIKPIEKSMHLTVLIAALALFFSFVIFNIIIGRLFMPVNNLLQATDALSAGNLDKRVKIIRNDEIGNISESFNNVADKMQFLINNLEAVVNERTEELNKTNASLEENKNHLRLILDSSAEAIYGIDLEGNCTFCNLSCIKLLGYTNQEELLGKNMHNLIHYCHADGTPLPVEECKISRAMKEKKGMQADDEVFWRPDGTFFAVEYHSFPQIKNGEVIGAVIAFMDITARKQREQEIHFLSDHDALTGLHNRRGFEDCRNKIDDPNHLPLSVIFADINGLKMTNDIFGHSIGDELIIKSANILTKSCREKDIVARVGGDEFVILLPKTNEEDAKKVLAGIKNGFSDERVAAIKCSISLGLDTKRSPDQSLEEIMTNAENIMYKDKTMNRQANNKDIINTIIETFHSNNSREKQHAVAVSKLCTDLGLALHLQETEISKLSRAGYLHDIGKIVIDENVKDKDYKSEEEPVKTRQHAVVGYRILNLFDDTLDLAEYVYGHHERWDGTGYPRGLKGEQIPLLSRIISVAESYDCALNRDDIPQNERKKAAIDFIKHGVGTKFDPLIVETFTRMMEDKTRA